MRIGPQGFDPRRPSAWVSGFFLCPLLLGHPAVTTQAGPLQTDNTKWAPQHAELPRGALLSGCRYGREARGSVGELHSATERGGRSMSMRDIEEHNIGSGMIDQQLHNG